MKRHSFEPIVQLQYTEILECKSNGTGIIIICSIYAYELILSSLVAYYAFRVRKLPSNFNETRYAAFITYVQLTTWGATVAVFTSGSFRTILGYLVQLCSAYSFLLCIFTPKLYIILRHPEKNTRDYVKATVTRNTMTSSFANSLSGLDLVITSAERSSRSRSETLPTTLSNNGSPASVAKSENTSSKKHMTICDVITEREVLNNLQIAIRQVTLKECFWEFPKKIPTKRQAMLFITNLKFKILVCNAQEGYYAKWTSSE